MHTAYQARQDSSDHFSDKVTDVLAVTHGKGPTVHTVQKTVEDISTIQKINQDKTRRSRQRSIRLSGQLRFRSFSAVTRTLDLCRKSVEFLRCSSVTELKDVIVTLQRRVLSVWETKKQTVRALQCRDQEFEKSAVR